MRILRLSLLSLLGLPLIYLQSTSASFQPAIQFNRDIRPILSDKCFFCHGPDERNRKAGLRLDTFEGATADRGGYKAITPGKPDNSELLTRVSSHDPAQMMPPSYSSKGALSETEIGLLRTWIAQGAKYEGHWAFQPVSRPIPPKTVNLKWIHNEIDRFILARLEKEKIRPSSQADPNTLIRRVSLDLTGLLPAPSEVEQFLTEYRRNPELAYSKLVDRLLASPHYGERWGRHWLDQARYADSNGYTIDGDRVMWPYRDWVINALNQDQPFDQFTVEQLAGDLLPNPTKSQLVATGFHRNTVINEEGGVDREQARVEQVMDRVNTTSAVWLGLTVGCAQCHSHKFDPIPQKDYYQLFAFFNSSSDVNNVGPTVPVQRGEMFGHPEADAGNSSNIPGPAEWESAELVRLKGLPPGNKNVVWHPLTVSEFDTESNGALTMLPDGTLLIKAAASPNDAYRVSGMTKLPRISAVRIRVLPHPELPASGPGLAANGNFVLSEFTCDVDASRIGFSNAFADHEQPGYPAKAAIDGDRRTGWAINVTDQTPGAKLNAPHEVVFTFSRPQEVAEKRLQFQLRHDVNAGYAVGRFIIEVADSLPFDPRADALLSALKTPQSERSESQKSLLNASYNSYEAFKEMTRGSVGAAMIIRDMVQPRETFILTRGDFTRPDRKPGVLKPSPLSAVPPSIDPGAGRLTRLDLARWLVDPRNPLTARVTMNRIWMRYFGRGLVETEEDFGTQGSAPSNPELLDWLATEFVSSGWRLKHMHRLIVMSSTYRQASDSRPDLTDKDPRNLLLARQERIRLDAEIIRDSALTASGLLSPVIGGPSVKPPQPEGVYAFTQVKKNWNAATGPDRYRRAMYTTFYRSAPYPFFTTFDSPDFQTVCTRRRNSDTPLQSLTMANDAMILELVQGIAARLIKDIPGTFEAQLDKRLRLAFMLCFSRTPSDEELRVLSGFVQSQLRTFKADPNSARQFAGNTAKGVTVEEAAALTAACRVLVNADNFITRE